MASTYPGSLDSFSVAHADAVNEIIHAASVNDLADAANKIEAELGVNPRGVYSDVKTRLAALETPTLNTQSGASYTLVLADASKIVGMSNAAANTITVPTNASVAFPTGTTVTLRQAGTGQVAVAAAGGVTVSSRGGLTHLAGQYAYATLVKVGTDIWELFGDLG